MTEAEMKANTRTQIEQTERILRQAGQGERTKRLALAACVIAAVLFATLVWPTVYRYDRMFDRPVRTNRLTGSVQMLDSTGWHAAPQAK